jgi:hypothetical protein
LANLITRILEDYDQNPPVLGGADAAIQDIADSFSDFPSVVLTEPLAYALGIGEQFFENYAPLSIPAAQMQS